MRSCLLQFQRDHEGGHNAIEWQRCDVAMYLISGHDIVKDATSLQLSMGKSMARISTCPFSKGCI